MPSPSILVCAAPWTCKSLSPPSSPFAPVISLPLENFTISSKEILCTLQSPNGKLLPNEPRKPLPTPTGTSTIPISFRILLHIFLHPAFPYADARGSDPCPTVPGTIYRAGLHIRHYLPLRAVCTVLQSWTTLHFSTPPKSSKWPKPNEQKEPWSRTLGFTVWNLDPYCLGLKPSSTVLWPWTSSTLLCLSVCFPVYKMGVILLTFSKLWWSKALMESAQNSV